MITDVSDVSDLYYNYQVLSNACTLLSTTDEAYSELVRNSAESIANTSSPLVNRLKRLSWCQASWISQYLDGFSRLDENSQSLMRRLVFTTFSYAILGLVIGLYSLLLRRCILRLLFVLLGLLISLHGCCAILLLPEVGNDFSAVTTLPLALPNTITQIL